MRVVDSCRSCGSAQLVEVLDLGDHYLADFRADDSRPPRVPLELLLCRGCMLVQLRHTADPADLYHPRYSFKSGVNDAIRADLADVARYALGFRPAPAAWLDIASNDGSLLAAVPPDVYRVGVDPLQQYADEARRHADRIVVGMFRPEHFVGATAHGDRSLHQRFDVVTSVSMFYDVDGPNEFVDGVKQVLTDTGVWIIQQNYLPSMLDAGSVDNISHEHVAYYSLDSLEDLLHRHGLEVNDVVLTAVNGGCFRTAVSRRGVRPVSASVAAQRAAENRAELGEPGTFRRFAGRARATLDDLAALVHGINTAGRRVYVYGASTRGGTLWQAAGLDVADLPYVVDRNPAKVGTVMSAIGAPIISEETMRADPPDYLLVGPWWFADQFADRESDYLTAGGRLIIPLPELRVIGR